MRPTEQQITDYMAQHNVNRTLAEIVLWTDERTPEQLAQDDARIMEETDFGFTGEWQSATMPDHESHPDW